MAHNAAKRVDDLINEAYDLSRDYEERWDKNHRWYAGDQWETNPPANLEHYTLNMTKRAVDALAAVMTEQRPRVVLQPAESNEPAIYYLPDNGTILQALRSSGEVLAGISDEQLVGEAPLSQDEFNAVMPLVQKLAEEGVVNPDDIHRVDDQAVADATHHIVQSMWDNGMWDIKIQSATKNSLITGHQGLVIEWDDDKQLMELKLVHYKQIGMDPNAFEGDVGEADYFTYVQPMSVDRAMEKFPDHAEAIRRHGGEGRLSHTGTSQSSLGGVYDNVNYKRKMVTLKTAFERREGKILRTRVIANEVIDEVETPFNDLPLVWIVNVPQPYRPYGIGEPEVLEDAQRLLNRLFTIHGNHTRYFQNPQSILPASLVKEMGGNASLLYSHPGRAFEIPDDLFLMLKGSPKLFVDPPSLQTAYTQMMQLLIEIFKDLSGNVDVLGGSIPGADTSGAAIKTLQTAARGTIGFRSLWLESALVGMVKVCLGLISSMLTEKAWEKYTDKYPIQVLRAIRDRAKNVDLDVRVEVVSGKGANRTAKKEESLLLFDRGAITLESLHDAFEVKDSKKQIQELQAQAQAAAEAEAAQQQGGAA